MTATDAIDARDAPDAPDAATDARAGAEARAVVAAGAPGAARPPARGSALLDDRLVARLALAITLAPFVVGAVALLVTVGGDYQPASDHALTELQVRSVGRDEVLVGLYSRDDWNHPGPALFYLLAPAYWLSGGMSVSISIAALAVNGAAVAGMALVARRRGGTPLMLVTLLGCALLMRTLGADFLQDPWNCFVTTLPFGLLIFLSWAMWNREAWALPAAAVVATFLAQTHVGFAALAPPFLAWGVIGLAVSAAVEIRPEERARTIRSGVRAGALALALLVVTWLPPVIEAIRHSPSNLRSIYRWFRYPEEEAHSLAEGWRVMAGQFGGVPEWLAVKRGFTVGGESPYIHDSTLPWMLLALLAAAAVLGRRRVAGARSLVVTTGLALAVGTVAVARTVGPAFDYRLRWTFVPAMVGAVVVGWAAWTVVAERAPRVGARLLAPATLAAVAVVGGVNVVTAATAGTPQNGNHDAMASLTEQVLDNLPETDGAVVVTDAYHSGAWHARGLVLQLERRGIDVGVPELLVHEYGRHRVVSPDDVGVVLVVTMDDTIDAVAERPQMRRIASWSALPEDEMRALLDERARLENDLEAAYRAGDRSGATRAAEHRFREIVDELRGRSGSIAYRAAVFVDTSLPPPADG